MFKSIEEVQRALAEKSYIADRALATTIYLAATLKKPIFLEGESGVGKTEVAKVVAQILSSKLIRLQCYEGLDANSALYEWNYPKQILQLKLDEIKSNGKGEIGKTIFSEEFLLKRPLLEAIQSDSGKPCVLLIDEIDRVDAEFEGFLLEILSDFQITIPEIGTIKADYIPFVAITSNRTREVHDALKRRCLYLWIDYPTFEKELEIVKAKVPKISETLAIQICNMIQLLRDGDYYKKPGIAETLDWSLALMALGKANLDPETVDATLGCIFKYQDDIQKARTSDIGGLVEKVAALKEELRARPRHAPLTWTSPR